MEEARAHELDVTAQVFPYTSNLSHISVLDSEDSREWPDEWFGDLERTAACERLTREIYPATGNRTVKSLCTTSTSSLW